MLKRLVVLGGMLAMFLAATVPADPAVAQTAEPDARIKGVIQAVRSVQEGPSYYIVEEGTGDEYDIASDAQGVDLSQYTGREVIVNGIFQTQGGDISDFPDPTQVPIYVTSVELPDDSTFGQEVAATGVLEPRGLAADRADITHYVTDEASGKLWGLISDNPQGVLDPYNGQRVTVTGTDATRLTPGGVEIPAIAVNSIEPADGHPGGTTPGEGRPFPLTPEDCNALVAEYGLPPEDPTLSFQGGSTLAGQVAFCQSMGLLAAQDETSMPAAFAKYSDTDGDGVISRAEFDAYFDLVQDDPATVYVPDLVSFKGYADDVGVAGLRVDSGTSGEPCVDGASYQVAFEDTKFYAREGEDLVPISIQDIGYGDFVEVEYDQVRDELQEQCPTPVTAQAVTVLQSNTPNAPKSPAPEEATLKAPAPGAAENGQYTDQQRVTQVSEGTSKSTTGDGASSGPDGGSGKENPSPGIAVLPDTGGTVWILGAGALLVAAGFLALKVILKAGRA